MKAHLFTRGLLACAAIGSTSSVASATIEAVVSGSARRPGMSAIVESFASNAPSYDMHAEVRNGIGGHGLGLQTLDFAGGRLTGREHACVGPPSPYLDQAFGHSDVSINEMFTVTSSTVPVGGIVSLEFCYSVTSNAYGSTLIPSLTDTSNVSNQFVLRINGNQLINGQHGVDVRSGARFSSLSFAGMTEETVTLAGSYTVALPVGFTFNLVLSVNSVSQTASRSAVNQFPNVNASGGYAATFGVHEITSGAHLNWRGQEWAGYCGDSSVLVPPNPAEGPAPSTLLTVCLAGSGWAARRR